MTPEPVPSRRVALRKRYERPIFMVNGLVFFIGAWEGVQSGGPRWMIALNVALGLAQMVALARSRGGALPTRFPYVLAALGLLTTSISMMGHKSALPYLYLLAALINAGSVVYGPKWLRRLIRGGAPMPE